GGGAGQGGGGGCSGGGPRGGRGGGHLGRVSPGRAARRAAKVAKQTHYPPVTPPLLASSWGAAWPRSRRPGTEVPCGPDLRPCRAGPGPREGSRQRKNLSRAAGPAG